MKHIVPLLHEARKAREKRAISAAHIRKPLEQLDKITDQAIVIIGERGLGKTTRVLQYLVQYEVPDACFYFSADNPLVTDLYLLVHELHIKQKITCLAIDEIHTAPDRQRHLKGIVDAMPELHLIVLGSSSLDLHKGTAALARRTRQVFLNTLSFREYCQLFYQYTIPQVSFSDIIAPLSTHTWYDHKLEIRFEEYVIRGYYPYSIDNNYSYHDTLRRNLQKTILEDIPTFLNVHTDTLSKLEKLFLFIASTPPSDFTYQALTKKIGLSKDVLETVLMYLHQIGVLNMVIRSNKLSDIMRKEFKALLGNPNMYEAFGVSKDRGALRESLVIHALRKVQRAQIIPDNMMLPRYGDIAFEYEGDRYTFEVGGKSKSKKQLEGVARSFVVTDQMQAGDGYIPLWHFALLEG